jgi:hypothetical protein
MPRTQSLPRCLAATLSLSLLLALQGLVSVNAQDALDKKLPVRGLCIAAPSRSGLTNFLRFIHDDLAPRSVNTLILRVDFNYQYTSRPELAEKSGLSREDVASLVAACRKHHIRIIPQINLLGHQSWQRSCGKLLQVYPEFDETPWVKFPDKYVWPNPDRLYCKSYCTLHPKVHEVVFALMDEICDAFEADAFHAGMDEVFYIGEDKCPRCGGKDKSELFAGEVRAIRDRLSLKQRELWIWGDRLLDGKTTGLGEWEASLNDTHRAIDMIPKDTVICDWHYERPDQTAVYFATKGLRVVTCPWNRPKVATQQLEDILRFRQRSAAPVRERILGVVQTVWSGNSAFLDRFYGPDESSEKSDSKCFRVLYEEIAAVKQIP